MRPYGTWVQAVSAGGETARRADGRSGRSGQSGRGGEVTGARRVGEPGGVGWARRSGRAVVRVRREWCRGAGAGGVVERGGTVGGVGWSGVRRSGGGRSGAASPARGLLGGHFDDAALHTDTVARRSVHAADEAQLLKGINAYRL